MTGRSDILIRFSVVALFLWFGVQQLLGPSMWTAYLPDWTGYLPVPGEMLVQLNGLAEVVGAGLLAAGVLTRVVAGLLGLHLLGIAVVAGGAVGVRDAALAFVTMALALSAPDEWTLDSREKKKPAEPQQPVV